MLTSAARPQERLVRRMNRLIRENRGGDKPQAPTAAVFEIIANGMESSVRLSSSAAETVARNGLKATALQELADTADFELRHLLEYIGIDRSTVSRQVSKDASLSSDASVKALQFADLLALAVDVFGSVDQASTWLVGAHPALDGETPLRRAGTPWGLDRVRSMLVGLKYGSAA